MVYIDSDPIVLAHGRALLEDHAHTRVLQADVRDPQAIREHPDTVELIDFDRPVAVVLSAILHHLNDDEDPRALVRYWQEQVPSGSYFFISHFRSGDNPQTAEAEAVLQSAFGRGRWRSDAEIRALFGDLEILEPGIVPSSLWRPDVASDPLHAGAAEAELTVWEQLIVGGLARKA